MSVVCLSIRTSSADAAGLQPTPGRPKTRRPLASAAPQFVDYSYSDDSGSSLESRTGANYRARSAVRSHGGPARSKGVAFSLIDPRIEPSAAFCVPALGAILAAVRDVAVGPRRGEHILHGTAHARARGRKRPKAGREECTDAHAARVDE